MKKLFAVTMIAALAVFAMACGPKKSKMQLLTANEWQLDEIVVKDSDFTETPPAGVTLVFAEADSRVSGHGGCNRFFGTFELGEGHDITISPVGSTMMACPDLEFEGRYFRFLEEVDKFEVYEDRLHLKINDDDTVLKFRPVLTAVQ